MLAHLPRERSARCAALTERSKLMELFSMRSRGKRLASGHAALRHVPLHCGHADAWPAVGRHPLRAPFVFRRLPCGDRISWTPCLLKENAVRVFVLGGTGSIGTASGRKLSEQSTHAEAQLRDATSYLFIGFSIKSCGAATISYVGRRRFLFSTSAVENEESNEDWRSGRV